MSSQSTTHTNEPQRKTMHEIAMELEPTIVDLEDNIIKSITILQELKEGYFDKFTQDNMKDNFGIILGFPHKGVLVDIILDYLLEMKRLQKVLDGYIYQD